MPCVSDTGATAPISALTYAFSIGSDRGLKANESGPEFVESPKVKAVGLPQRRPKVPQSRRQGDAEPIQMT